MANRCVIYSTASSCSLCHALTWIERLTAEPLRELVGVSGISEAVHVGPLAFVEDRVTALAQRQITAELLHCLVTAVGGSTGRYDLVWPPTVDGCR